MAVLPTISLASVVIGFISFGLTLAIWLNSFWNAFVTVGGARSQIRDELSILRQRLYEELNYLQRIRRRERRGSRKHSHHHHHHHDSLNDKEDDRLYDSSGPIRVLLDAVRDLTKDFKRYESPFLVIPGKTDRRKERDLEWSFDATKQHYQCDLSRRLLWLRAKGGVQSIADKLQKIQVQRAAMESTECKLMLIDAMGMIRDTEDRMNYVEDLVRAVDQRLMGARFARSSAAGDH